MSFFSTSKYRKEMGTSLAKTSASRLALQNARIYAVSGVTGAADPTRAEKLLKWKAKRSLDEIVATAWKWDEHVRSAGK